MLIKVPFPCMKLFDRQRVTLTSLREGQYAVPNGLKYGGLAPKRPTVFVWSWKLQLVFSLRHAAKETTS